MSLSAVQVVLDRQQLRFRQVRHLELGKMTASWPLAIPSRQSPFQLQMSGSLGLCLKGHEGSTTSRRR